MKEININLEQVSNERIELKGPLKTQVLTL